ncbi:GNAT family N-acetyltransferase [Rhizobium sp. MHM7A]|uniref:GNAT family N-acetyltransferase n=1 Tax=Rhizobium sp. MHM7A TaxID=2583233 RepID=UPI001106BD42|nr:GNAT family N-acetyltransferase [Rhizobium sp. MHM7A]TLX16058.1 GNAT family N-acetyltransferase [Rhizobium sp. MHM7A]
MFDWIATALSSRLERRANEAEITPARRFQREMNRVAEECDGLVLKMMVDGDDGIFVTYLQVSPLIRRSGIATKMLSKLVEQADKLNVRMVLNATPMDDNNCPSHKELVDFYERYGFIENWDYESPCTAMFEAKRDGSWTRMVRPANSPANILSPGL